MKTLARRGSLVDEQGMTCLAYLSAPDDALRMSHQYGEYQTMSKPFRRLTPDLR